MCKRYHWTLVIPCRHFKITYPYQDVSMVLHSPAIMKMANDNKQKCRPLGTGQHSSLKSSHTSTPPPLSSYSYPNQGYESVIKPQLGVL